MRILMAGDTHGDASHVRHLLSVAQLQRCDRIFVLGDFGYWEHTGEGRNFLNRVDIHADLKDIPIYFLDGNHDKTSLLLENYDKSTQFQDGEGFLLVREYVRYARRGLTWIWDDVEFIALGGAYSVDKQWRLDQEAKTGKPESLWFPEEEMTDEEMNEILEELDGRSVDVMLAHDKPRSSNPDWNRKDFLECLPNQDRLQAAVQALRPVLYLHGHLHFRYTGQAVYPIEKMSGGYMGECRVEGLDCNTRDQDFTTGRTVPDLSASWYVLDTDDVKKMIEEREKW